MYDADQLTRLFSSVFTCGLGLAALALAVAILYFLSTCYARIPPEHRRMEPGMVWLLLIPLFNLVWLYFVYIRLAKSFAAAYAAQGRTDVDGGEKLALAYCILTSCSIIPVVGCVAAPAALVLLVIVLIKFNALKSELPASA